MIVIHNYTYTYNERYVPKRLRDEKKDHYWEDELGKCTSIIKVRWTMMIIMIQRLISPYLHQSDWWKMIRYILVFWMRHTCLPTLLFRWFKLLYTLGWEYWILVSSMKTSRFTFFWIYPLKCIDSVCLTNNTSLMSSFQQRIRLGWYGWCSVGFVLLYSGDVFNSTELLMLS